MTKIIAVSPTLAIQCTSDQCENASTHVIVQENQEQVLQVIGACCAEHMKIKKPPLEY